LCCVTKYSLLHYISVLSDVTKTFIKISLYYFFELSMCNIFKQIDKEINILKISFFTHINNIFELIVLSIKIRVEEVNFFITEILILSFLIDFCKFLITRVF